jgi:hypothetical protein
MKYSTAWPEGLTLVIMLTLFLLVGIDTVWTAAYWNQFGWADIQAAVGMWLIFRALDLVFQGPSRRRIRRVLDEQAKRHIEASKNGYRL